MAMAMVDAPSRLFHPIFQLKNSECLLFLPFHATFSHLTRDIA
jgi:hypothetical protein